MTAIRSVGNAPACAATKSCAPDYPDYVMTDLEFDGARKARSVHVALREPWGCVDEMHGPQARMAETVEVREY